MASQSRELIFQGCRYLLPPTAFLSREDTNLVLKVNAGGFSLSLPLEALPAANHSASVPVEPADGVSEQQPLSGECGGVDADFEMPSADLDSANAATQAQLPAAAAAQQASARAAALPTTSHPDSGTTTLTTAKLHDTAALESIPDSMPEPISPPMSGDKENAHPPAAEQNDAEANNRSKTAKHKDTAPPKNPSTAKKAKHSLSPSIQPPSPMKGNQYQWRQLTDLTVVNAEDKPVGRWGATMTRVTAHQALLYGGSDPEGPLADSWMLDMAQGSLTLLQNSEKAKAWHSAQYLTTESGRYVVVYGGEAIPDTEEGREGDSDVVPDTCMLDISDTPTDSMWVDVPMFDEHKQAPPERAGHSCTTLPDGRLLIFGGMDTGGKYHNDIWIMHPLRLTWHKLTKAVRGAPPKARAYHTATLVGNRVVVLGGNNAKLHWALKEVYTLSIDTFTWKEHTSEVEGEAPSPRCGHSAVAHPDGRHLLVFGGGNSEAGNFTSTLSILDTHTWRWTAAQVQGAARPAGRLGQTMVLLSPPGDAAPVVVMHGGRTWGDNLLDDTWMLQLPAIESL
ncbi:hypothetical protein WJX73_004753 [Symbiochloris irregularis]|uniref:Attractin/MKLN-like beta-propeller domain-containing protein n=1 Tax=Symbiochloris irregularis TaxID=706552 RepID=A0AAW1NR74_9CHLO